MKKNLKAALVLSAVVLALNTPVSHADDDVQEMAAIASQFGFITLEQASEKALAAKPGVIKEAELDKRNFGKGWDYEFEIVDADGREWEVKIDAKTGAVVKVSRDWF